MVRRELLESGDEPQGFGFGEAYLGNGNQKSYVSTSPAGPATHPAPGTRDTVLILFYCFSSLSVEESFSSRDRPKQNGEVLGFRLLSQRFQ